jgi:hypothetical protein
LSAEPESSNPAPPKTTGPGRLVPSRDQWKPKIRFEPERPATPAGKTVTRNPHALPSPNHNLVHQRERFRRTKKEHPSSPISHSSPPPRTHLKQNAIMRARTMRKNK